MSKTAIRERPMIFTAESVRAIMDGRKTQTRRVLRKQPPKGFEQAEFNGVNVWAFVRERREREWFDIEPAWSSGDRLWVKENFAYADDEYGSPGIVFAADEKF